MMDLDTCETKDDLRLPEGDLGDQIKQVFEKDNEIIVCLFTLAIYIFRESSGIF